MSELRAGINQTVLKLLDEYGADGESEVLDSSHVIGGLVIMRFLRRRNKARAKKMWKKMPNLGAAALSAGLAL